MINEGQYHHQLNCDLISKISKCIFFIDEKSTLPSNDSQRSQSKSNLHGQKNTSPQNNIKRVALLKMDALTSSNLWAVCIHRFLWECIPKEPAFLHVGCCWLKQLRKTFFILLFLPATNCYSRFVSVYATKSFHSLPWSNYTSNQDAGFALYAVSCASTRRYFKLASIPYMTLPLSFSPSEVFLLPRTQTRLALVQFWFAPVWFCTALIFDEDSERETSSPLSFVFTKPGLKSSSAQQCKLECDSCNYFFTKSPTVDAVVSVRDIFFLPL